MNYGISDAVKHRLFFFAHNLFLDQSRIARMISKGMISRTVKQPELLADFFSKAWKSLTMSSSVSCLLHLSQKARPYCCVPCQPHGHLYIALRGMSVLWCLLSNSSCSFAVCWFRPIFQTWPHERHVRRSSFIPIPPYAAATQMLPVRRPPAMARPVLNPFLFALICVDPHFGHFTSSIRYQAEYIFPLPNRRYFAETL